MGWTSNRIKGFNAFFAAGIFVAVLHTAAGFLGSNNNVVAPTVPTSANLPAPVSCPVGTLFCFQRQRCINLLDGSCLPECGPGEQLEMNYLGQYECFSTNPGPATCSPDEDLCGVPGNEYCAPKGTCSTNTQTCKQGEVLCYHGQFSFCVPDGKCFSTPIDDCANGGCAQCSMGQIFCAKTGQCIYPGGSCTLTCGVGEEVCSGAMGDHCVPMGTCYTPLVCGPGEELCGSPGMEYCVTVGTCHMTAQTCKHDQVLCYHGQFSFCVPVGKCSSNQIDDCAHGGCAQCSHDQVFCAKTGQCIYPGGSCTLTCGIGEEVCSGAMGDHCVPVGTCYTPLVCGPGEEPCGSPGMEYCVTIGTCHMTTQTCKHDQVLCYHGQFSFCVPVGKCFSNQIDDCTLGGCAQCSRDQVFCAKTGQCIYPGSSCLLTCGMGEEICSGPNGDYCVPVGTCYTPITCSPGEEPCGSPGMEYCVTIGTCHMTTQTCKHDQELCNHGQFSFCVPVGKCSSNLVDDCTVGGCAQCSNDQVFCSKTGQCIYPGSSCSLTCGMGEEICSGPSGDYCVPVGTCYTPITCSPGEEPCGSPGMEYCVTIGTCHMTTQTCKHDQVLCYHGQFSFCVPVGKCSSNLVDDCTLGGCAQCSHDQVFCAKTGQCIYPGGPCSITCGMGEEVCSGPNGDYCVPVGTCYTPITCSPGEEPCGSPGMEYCVTIGTCHMTTQTCKHDQVLCYHGQFSFCVPVGKCSSNLVDDCTLGGCAQCSHDQVFCAQTGQCIIPGSPCSQPLCAIGEEICQNMNDSFCAPIGTCNISSSLCGIGEVMCQNMNGSFCKPIGICNMSSSPCGPGEEICQNMNGSFCAPVGTCNMTTSPCGQGEEMCQYMNGSFCAPVGTCNMTTPPCGPGEEMCQNMNGSICAPVGTCNMTTSPCGPGMEMCQNMNGSFCAPIGTCNMTTSPCGPGMEMCQNMNGSFCAPFGTCNMTISPCGPGEEMCQNMNGSFCAPVGTCNMTTSPCGPGMEMCQNMNGSFCAPIGTCNMTTSPCGPGMEMCQNMNGSFCAPFGTCNMTISPCGPGEEMCQNMNGSFCAPVGTCNMTTSPCGPGMEMCQNMNGSFCAPIGTCNMTTSPCGPGMEMCQNMNGSFCAPIGTCNMTTSPCGPGEEMCLNMNGSFCASIGTCNMTTSPCGPGEEMCLNMNGSFCAPVGTCNMTTSPCGLGEEMCQNMNGSFCAPIGTCNMTTSPCGPGEEMCKNMNGSFCAPVGTCNMTTSPCGPGEEMCQNMNGSFCAPVGTCNMTTSPCGPGEEMCQNMNGSFCAPVGTCNMTTSPCGPGEEMCQNMNGSFCAPVGTCNMTTSPCGPGEEMCLNMNGSFCAPVGTCNMTTSPCGLGEEMCQYMNGSFCAPIGTCNMTTSPCGPGEEMCLNMNGSFCAPVGTCNMTTSPCGLGEEMCQYMNGSFCAPIGTCNMTTSPCGPGEEMCLNMNGSFCAPVGTCNMTTSPCGLGEEMCQYMNGSFCAPIGTCNMTTSPCGPGEEMCLNMNGSFCAPVGTCNMTTSPCGLGEEMCQYMNGSFCAPIGTCNMTTSPCGPGEEICLNMNGSFCAPVGTCNMTTSPCGLGEEMCQYMNGSFCAPVGTCNMTTSPCGPGEEMCQNMNGSFCAPVGTCNMTTSSCGPGEEMCLNMNGSFCAPVGTCNMTTSPCGLGEEMCQYMNGSFCAPIGTCNMTTSPCGPGEEMCLNMNGSFCAPVGTCNMTTSPCGLGEEMCQYMNGSFCAPIGTCNMTTSPCGPGEEICLNMNGSFCAPVGTCNMTTSPCGLGEEMCQYMNGSFCAPVGTCNMTTSPCGPGEEMCQNMNGSFCAPVGTCNMTTSPCGPGEEMCLNMNGSFCAPVGTCNMTTSPCGLGEEMCQYMNGSFCAPIGTCNMTTSPCGPGEEMCLNMNGSFCAPFGTCNMTTSPCGLGEEMCQYMNGSFCAPIGTCNMTTSPCGPGEEMCQNMNGSFCAPVGTCNMTTSPCGPGEEMCQNMNGSFCAPVGTCNMTTSPCGPGEEMCLNMNGSFCAPVGTCNMTTSPCGLGEEMCQYMNGSFCAPIGTCNMTTSPCGPGEEICLNMNGSFCAPVGTCNMTTSLCGLGEEMCQYMNGSFCAPIGTCNMTTSPCGPGEEMCQNMNGSFCAPVGTCNMTTSPCGPGEEMCQNMNGSFCAPVGTCNMTTSPCGPGEEMCLNMNGSFCAPVGTCNMTTSPCGLGEEMCQYMNGSFCAPIGTCNMTTSPCGPGEEICLNMNGSFCAPVGTCNMTTSLCGLGEEMCQYMNGSFCAPIGTCNMTTSPCGPGEEMCQNMNGSFCAPVGTCNMTTSPCGPGEEMCQNMNGSFCAPVGTCNMTTSPCGPGEEMCLNMNGSFCAPVGTCNMTTSPCGLGEEMCQYMNGSFCAPIGTCNMTTSPCGPGEEICLNMNGSFCAPVGTCNMTTSLCGLGEEMCQYMNGSFCAPIGTCNMTTSPCGPGEEMCQNMNGSFCAPVGTCNMTTSPCGPGEEMCQNMNGSFCAPVGTCNMTTSPCGPGEEMCLNMNGSFCAPVGTCNMTTSPCGLGEEMCQYMNGSFCAPIGTCNMTTSPCGPGEEMCQNMNGSFCAPIGTCNMTTSPCGPGEEMCLNMNGSFCAPVGTCNMTTSPCGPGEEMCQNMNGSFCAPVGTCNMTTSPCGLGEELCQNMNGSFCAPIGTCNMTTSPCGPGEEMCQNMNGSFCAPVGTCNMTTSPCGPGEEMCQNMNGSFCAPVGTCNMTTSPCGLGEELCQNMNGSFCAPIGTCNMTTSPCGPGEEICQNMNGSFCAPVGTCNMTTSPCGPGEEMCLNMNGSFCASIGTCNMTTSPCGLGEEMCLNMNGSFCAPIGTCNMTTFPCGPGEEMCQNMNGSLCAPIGTCNITTSPCGPGEELCQNVNGSFCAPVGTCNMTTSPCGPGEELCDNTTSQYCTPVGTCLLNTGFCPVGEDSCWASGNKSCVVLGQCQVNKVRILTSAVFSSPLNASAMWSHMVGQLASLLQVPEEPISNLTAVPDTSYIDIWTSLPRARLSDSLQDMMDNFVPMFDPANNTMVVKGFVSDSCQGPACVVTLNDADCVSRSQNWCARFELCLSAGSVCQEAPPPDMFLIKIPFVAPGLYTPCLDEIPIGDWWFTLSGVEADMEEAVAEYLNDTLIVDGVLIQPINIENGSLIVYASAHAEKGLVSEVDLNAKLTNDFDSLSQNAPDIEFGNVTFVKISEYAMDTWLYPQPVVTGEERVLSLPTLLPAGMVTQTPATLNCSDTPGMQFKNLDGTFSDEVTQLTTMYQPVTMKHSLSSMTMFKCTLQTVDNFVKLRILAVPEHLDIMASIVSVDKNQSITTLEMDEDSGCHPLPDNLFTFQDNSNDVAQRLIQWAEDMAIDNEYWMNGGQVIASWLKEIQGGRIGSTRSLTAKVDVEDNNSTAIGVALKFRTQQMPDGFKTDSPTCRNNFMICVMPDFSGSLTLRITPVLASGTDLPQFSLSVNVLPTNDVPVLNMRTEEIQAGVTSLVFPRVPVPSAGDPAYSDPEFDVCSIGAEMFVDTDDATAEIGLAVFGFENKSVEGIWRYSVNGAGDKSTWPTLPEFTGNNQAVMLQCGAKLTFIPTANFISSSWMRKDASILYMMGWDMSNVATLNGATQKDIALKACDFNADLYCVDANNDTSLSGTVVPVPVLRKGCDDIKNSGLEQTQCGCGIPADVCTDCNGDVLGDADYDSCGRCVGGLTGLPVEVCAGGTCLPNCSISECWNTNQAYCEYQKELEDAQSSLCPSGEEINLDFDHQTCTLECVPAGQNADTCYTCGENTCLDCANVTNGNNEINLCGDCRAPADMHTNCTFGNIQPRFMYNWGVMNISAAISSSMIPDPSNPPIIECQLTSSDPSAVVPTIVGSPVYDSNSSTINFTTSVPSASRSSALGPFSVACLLDGVTIPGSGQPVTRFEHPTVTSISTTEALSTELGKYIVNGSNFVDTGIVRCVVICDAADADKKVCAHGMPGKRVSDTQVKCNLKNLKVFKTGRTFSIHVILDEVKNVDLTSLPSGVQFTVRSPAPQVKYATLHSRGCPKIKVKFNMAIAGVTSDSCSSYFVDSQIATAICTVVGYSLVIEYQGEIAVGTVFTFKDNIIKHQTSTVADTFSGSINITTSIPKIQPSVAIYDAPDTVGCVPVILKRQHIKMGCLKAQSTWSVDVLDKDPSDTVLQDNLDILNNNLVGQKKFRVKETHLLDNYVYTFTLNWTAGIYSGVSTKNLTKDSSTIATAEILRLAGEVDTTQEIKIEAEVSGCLYTLKKMEVSWSISGPTIYNNIPARLLSTIPANTLQPGSNYTATLEVTLDSVTITKERQFKTADLEIEAAVQYGQDVSTDDVEVKLTDTVDLSCVNNAGTTDTSDLTCVWMCQDNFYGSNEDEFYPCLDANGDIIQKTGHTISLQESERKDPIFWDLRQEWTLVMKSQSSQIEANTTRTMVYKSVDGNINSADVVQPEITVFSDDIMYVSVDEKAVYVKTFCKSTTSYRWESTTSDDYAGLELTASTVIGSSEGQMTRDHTKSAPCGLELNLENIKFLSGEAYTFRLTAVNEVSSSLTLSSYHTMKIQQIGSPTAGSIQIESADATLTAMESEVEVVLSDWYDEIDGADITCNIYFYDNTMTTKANVKPVPLTQSISKLTLPEGEFRFEAICCNSFRMCSRNETTSTVTINPINATDIATVVTTFEVKITLSPEILIQMMKFMYAAITDATSLNETEKQTMNNTMKTAANTQLTTIVQSSRDSSDMVDKMETLDIAAQVVLDIGGSSSMDSDAILTVQVAVKEAVTQATGQSFTSRRRRRSTTQSTDPGLTAAEATTVLNSYGVTIADTSSLTSTEATDFSGIIDGAMIGMCIEQASSSSVMVADTDLVSVRVHKTTTLGTTTAQWDVSCSNCTTYPAKVVYGSDIEAAYNSSWTSSVWTISDICVSSAQMSVDVFTPAANAISPTRKSDIVVLKMINPVTYATETHTSLSDAVEITMTLENATSINVTAYNYKCKMWVSSTWSDAECTASAAQQSGADYTVVCSCTALGVVSVFEELKTGDETTSTSTTSTTTTTTATTTTAAPSLPVSSGAVHLNIEFSFNDDYDTRVPDKTAFEVHIRNQLISYTGYTTSNIQNMAATKGSIIVTFDLYSTGSATLGQMAYVIQALFNGGSTFTSVDGTTLNKMAGSFSYTEEKSSSDDSSSNNVGAIVGGVLGGLAIIGIVVVAIVLVVKYKSRPAHPAPNPITPREPPPSYDFSLPPPVGMAPPPPYLYEEPTFIPPMWTENEKMNLMEKKKPLGGEASNGSEQSCSGSNSNLSVTTNANQVDRCPTPVGI